MKNQQVLLAIQKAMQTAIESPADTAGLIDELELAIKEVFTFEKSIDTDF